MGKIKQFIDLLFTKKFISKFVAYTILLVVFYLFTDFLGIFLLTFVFAYLFLTSSEFIKMKLDNLLLFHCKDQKKLKYLKKIFGLNFIIISLYLIFIGIIIFILSDIIPQLTGELKSVEKIVGGANDIKEKLEVVAINLDGQYNFHLTESLQKILNNFDLGVLVNDITLFLSKAGKGFIYIIFSLVLSFVFIIDRNRLKKYFLGIKKSNFNFLYKEYKIIFEKILKSFGLILKAQSLIALVNATLTIIGLLIIGFFFNSSIDGVIFPFILTLGLIVFLAGFIPILGVFISSIPILLIAYLTIGGWSVLISIVLLILIIHFIEAYYLNPKIVSSFLEVPVSLTFIILLISENLFGIAGLIIGVSMFYFIVGLLRDIDKVLSKNKKGIKKLKQEK